jgi:TolA-binding protein
MKSHPFSAALQRICVITLCASIALCAHISTSAAADAKPMRALAGDSDQRNRQFQKAEALYLSGRLKEAATAFGELTRKYPDDARAWFKYGNTLTKQQSFDEAATAFQTAINLDASQGSAALNLALVRLAQAQASLGVAVARLAADSPERAQAEAIQREMKTLLGMPDGGTPSH